MKNNKGITLIALIITIIVMLILVGVSVSIVINSKLIKTTDMAGFKQKISAYNEQYQTYLLGKKYGNENFDTNTINIDSDDEEFSKIFGPNVSDEDKQCMKVVNGCFIYETSDESKNQALQEIGLAKWRFVTDSNGKNTGVTNGIYTLNLGDTINYKGNDEDTNEWKVFGVGDNGELSIVTTGTIMAADRTLKLGTSLMEGTKTMYDFIDILDEACEVYGQGDGAVGARAIRVRDVDNLTNYDKESYVGGSEFEKYGTQIKFSWHDDENVPRISYVKEDGSESEPTAFTNTNHTEFYGFDLKTGQVYGPVAKGTDIPSMTNTYYTYDIINAMGENSYPVGSPIYQLLYTTTRIYYLADINYTVKPDYARYGMMVMEKIGPAVSGEKTLQLKSYSFCRSYPYEYNLTVSDFDTRPVVYLKSDIPLVEGTTTDWKIDL